MSNNFLIWSCNKRKFLKIVSTKDGYKERIGSKLNSIFYINVRIFKEYDESKFCPNLADCSYYTNWEISIKRENGLNSLCINAKLISNTKVLVDKDLYFGEISSPFYCNTTKLTGYNLDCVLRFPDSNPVEDVVEEPTLISKLKYVVDDLQAILDKSQLTDVTLKCGTEVIKAHKIILCARSPVFETMFSIPMQESKEHIVVVKDIDSGIFQAVINFIYSGQVKITSAAMACDLLYAGEKYQIKGLNEGCVKYLKSLLSPENAIKILEVADLYDSKLKLDALNLVKENFDELKDTTEWKELKTKNATLALEVYSLND